MREREEKQDLRNVQGLSRECASLACRKLGLCVLVVSNEVSVQKPDVLITREWGCSVRIRVLIA